MPLSAKLARITSKWPRNPVRKFGAAASAMALRGALALSACQHSTFFAGVTVGPPLVLGPVGVPPGPGWVWTDGFYDWVGNRWVWRPERWAQPPHPGWVWRQPRHVRHHNRF